MAVDTALPGHGVFIADEGADIRHRLETFVLVNCHREQRRAFLIVGIYGLLIQYFQGEGDVHGVIQPHDLQYAVHLLQRLLVRKRLGNRHVPHHDPGVRNPAIKFLLHDIQGDG